MKALVLNEYKKLDLMEVPSPAAAPDEVLVRVRSCGICGSDVRVFQRLPCLPGLDEARRHPGATGAERLGPAGARAGNV